MTGEAQREATVQSTCETGCAFHGRGVEPFDVKLETAGLPNLRKLVQQQLQKSGRCRLLEIGCAEGRLLLELLEEFGSRLELHGTNYDKYPATFGADQLERTNTHYGIMPAGRLRILPRPRIHSADLQDMSAFPVRDFDLIISQAVIPHIPHKLRALEQSARLLAPRGTFIHELDSCDLPPLDFLSTDLPRLSIGSGAQRVSASNYLRQHGVELRVTRPYGRRGYMALYQRRKGPLRLQLALDESATRELSAIPLPQGRHRLWGVHSGYTP